MNSSLTLAFKTKEGRTEDIAAKIIRDWVKMECSSQLIPGLGSLAYSFTLGISSWSLKERSKGDHLNSKGKTLAMNLAKLSLKEGTPSANRLKALDSLRS